MKVKSVWASARSAFLRYAIVLFVALSFSGCGDGGLKAEFQEQFEASKQSLFDIFHPIGTAKRVVVHSVAVQKTAAGPQAEIRLTLYWEGPVTKDGFTKILARYDQESQRLVGARILSTNGLTTNDVADGLALFFSIGLE